MKAWPLGKLIGWSLIYLYAWISVSPALAQDSSIPRPTGSLQVLSGPDECDDQDCYEVEITCPEVIAPARARLRVGKAIGTQQRGTILFATGALGTSLYQDRNRGSEIVQRSRRAGFQTVQLQWIDSWLLASEGEEAGHVRLACRPATVAGWVYDHLASRSDGNAFCATGHSGGAAQISYMLSHYGLEEVLDAVVPTGGPPMAQSDRYCDRSDPISSNLEQSGLVWARNVIDGALGYLPESDRITAGSFDKEGAGPCARGEQSYYEVLRGSSVASGDGDYLHRNTMVSFIVEGIDNMGAAAQGRIYYDLLKSRGSPLLELATVPNVTHGGGVGTGLYDSDEGNLQVQNTLLRVCRVWN